MKRLPWLRASAVRLGAGAAVLLVALQAPAANLPDWGLVGEADVLLDAGIHDAKGTYDLPFEGQTPRVTVNYAPDGTLKLDGFVLADGNPTLFQFIGTQSVDEQGVEHVALYDRLRKPRWRFDGTMSANGGDITGTYTRAEGFAGFPGTSAGPLTIARFNPATGPDTFRLRMKTTTDTKGNVKGGFAFDGVSEAQATVAVHGGVTLVGGRIRGKIKTNNAAMTTGKVKITAKNWSMSLAGPLDAAGFHAICDFRGGGFRVDDAPLLIPVVPGFEDPPDTQPPPKNPNGSAVVNDILGTVEVDARVPIAGAKRDATIQFPDSLTSGTITANPASSSGQGPIRFITQLGGTTYGTAMAPASVAIQIVRFSRIGGDIIELRCTGTVVAEGGKSKNVDVTVLAVVE